MVSCGFCGHKGGHATITTVVGGASYCTGWRECQKELRE
jgi:hypothetical protein